jgi:hypothetical protein
MVDPLFKPYLNSCLCAFCCLQDTDSAGQKLGGALLNAIIFMAVIAGMTFVLFLLFKWGVSAYRQQQQQQHLS